MIHKGAGFDALLERARRGSNGGWTELLTPHRKMLARRARLHLPKGQVLLGFSASDLEQQAYLSAARTIHGFRGTSHQSFGAWIAAIVSNAARTLRRRARLFDGQESETSLGYVAAADHEAIVEIIRDEQRHRAFALVTGVKDDEARSVAIAYLETNGSIRGAAKSLGLSEGATRAAWIRACRAMRRAVQVEMSKVCGQALRK